MVSAAAFTVRLLEVRQGLGARLKGMGAGRHVHHLFIDSSVCLLSKFTQPHGDAISLTFALFQPING